MSVVYGEFHNVYVCFCIGTVMFHLRMQNANMPKKKKKKGGRLDQSAEDLRGFQPDGFGGMPPKDMPFLMELNPGK